MNFVLALIGEFIFTILDVLYYMLMFYIIIGWVIFFGGIRNPANPFLRLYFFLVAKIEPILGKIRMVVPPIMGLDFSPLALFFIIYLLQVLVKAFFRSLM